MDLKLENILLDTPGPLPHVIIADFGAAEFETTLYNLKGTMVYLSPEVLNKQTRKLGYDPQKADCWALGLCTYLLLTGFNPFDGNYDPTPIQISYEVLGSVAHTLSERDLITCNNIIYKQVPIHDSFGSDDHDIRSFIFSLLDRDPTSRLTASKALRHPWFLSSQKELIIIYNKKVSPPRLSLDEYPDIPSLPSSFDQGEYMDWEDDKSDDSNMSRQISDLYV